MGIRVSKELGIPFYDKELLQEAAKKSGLCEKIFENFDERPKSLLYSIAMDSYMFALPGAGAGDSLEQQVYLATFNTIRHLAEQGPCVIIGRCADYALADNPNLLSIFIHAPMDVRIARVAKRQNLTPEKARQLILKTDKRRASYYEYYSSQKWGTVESYDFCLDSSVFGIVSFAWAGFGGSFGAVVLCALFWKRCNWQGALAGMLCGGLMVFVWKYIVSPLGGVFGIYELLPAFLVSLAVCAVVSLVTPAPTEDILAEFDAAK